MPRLWLVLLLVVGCADSRRQADELLETRRKIAEAEKRWPDMVRYTRQGHLYRVYRKGYTPEAPAPEIFHDPECPCTTGKPFESAEVWKGFE